jgi:hypothetical protein
LITLIFAFLLGCLLESHNKGSPTHLKEVDDAHAQVFECEHSAHLDQPATLNPIPHLNSLPRAKTSDAVMQHIHWVEPAPAPQGPTPLLIRLDQRRKNVEFIARWRTSGRAPKLLDLGECVAVVLVSADRADLHGGHYQNLATVRASIASYSAWVPINFTNTICLRKSNAAINR